MSLSWLEAVGSLLVVLATQTEPSFVHISSSTAITVAQTIARGEGYEIRTDLDDVRQSPYDFDVLTASGGRPLVRGYIAIGFTIDERARNLILINERTGQTIDMNSCEVFDFPALRSFENQIIRLTKATRLTPQQLADNVGCSSAILVTKPVPIKKGK